MTPMRRTETWLPDVFNDFFNNSLWPVYTTKNRTTAPAINVHETKNDYTVEVAAPGTKKEEFDVQLTDDGNLHIKLEHKEEHKDEEKKVYLRREFSYFSKFEQTLILPDDVDKEKISAHVDNGVLTILLPKISQKEEPKIGRKVEIL